MLVGPPSEGVSNGSVGGWLTGTSVDEGWKLVSFGFRVFSGSFGVRSIVLCKCSGKYIDIYFKLEITYPLVPYPHTYIALYHSHVKVTSNTHTHTKTRNC